MPKVKWVNNFLPIPYPKEWLWIWVWVMDNYRQVYFGGLLSLRFGEMCAWSWAIVVG
jgi:hypothetical protein